MATHCHIYTKCISSRTYKELKLLLMIELLKYLGNMISEFKTDMTTKIHWYNKINGTIKRKIGKICSQAPNYNFTI
jgi:phosphoribosylaminoimidazole carboxylase (NCAIR synthetase)